MDVIESAAAYAQNIAADDSHGYDQAGRWGPDYDCSSLVISAFRKAGVPLSCTYTGNMRGDMLRCGFEDVTGSVDLNTGAGLERGDVLLNHVHHTALYIGGGQLIQASINEHGITTGGQTGDQTGREICTRGYYNYPWDCVLRYTEEEQETERAAEYAAVELPVLQRGDTGEAVRAMQVLLRGCGFGVGWYGADGEFGAATEDGLRAFQRVKREETDGVCGERTWSDAAANRNVRTTA